MVERERAAEALAAVKRAPLWLWAMLIPVACTLLFWAVLPAEYRVSESSDYESFYRPVAENLLNGRGITNAAGQPAIHTPPGYPVLVAGVLFVGKVLHAPENTALAVFTLLCVAISSLFLHLITSDLWKRWKALLPSAVWSTYPLALWLTKQPNSEVPFTVFLFAIAWVTWKLTRSERPRIDLAVLLGVLAGAAMLIRPIAVGMPFVLAVLVLLLSITCAWWRRVLVAAVLVATSMIVITPWQNFAEGATGHFVLLSNAGVTSMRDGLTFGVNTNKTYRTGIYLPDPVRTVMINFYAQYDQLDSFRPIAQACAREFRTHPVGSLELLGLKLIRAWFGTDSQRLDRYILWLQIVYLALIGWTARRAWQAGADRRRLTVIAGTFLTYFWGMSVLALPLVRYLVPAVGLAMVLAPALLDPRREYPDDVVWGRRR